MRAFAADLLGLFVAFITIIAVAACSAVLVGMWLGIVWWAAQWLVGR